MQVMLAEAAADLSAGLDKYWAAIDGLFRAKGPFYMAPKLDGVRGAISAGEVMSRTWKPIRSKAIQDTYGSNLLNGCDGEFIAGDPTDSNAMQKATSATSKKGAVVIPDYYVFDTFVHPNATFTERWKQMQRLEVWLRDTDWRDRIKIVPQRLIYSADQAKEYLEQLLAAGYEGGMLRHPDSPYKFGRSTQREAYLLKLKMWEDSEAQVMGCYELEHNLNPQIENELGKLVRSSSKAGKYGGDTLGGFEAQDIKTGVTFRCGIAVEGVWDAKTRQELWNKRSTLPGRVFTYRHFPTGVVAKPRFPKFVSWRDSEDM